MQWLEQLTSHDRNTAEPRSDISRRGSLYSIWVVVAINAEDEEALRRRPVEKVNRGHQRNLVSGWHWNEVAGTLYTHWRTTGCCQTTRFCISRTRRTVEIQYFRIKIWSSDLHQRGWGLRLTLGWLLRIPYWGCISSRAHYQLRFWRKKKKKTKLDTILEFHSSTNYWRQGP